jgi:hypothetical protein
MRVVADIPHEVMKITVFHWNEKYIVKFEVGLYEQTYKFGTSDSVTLEQVRKVVSQEFCDRVLDRFKEMRSDFGNALQMDKKN